MNSYDDCTAQGLADLITHHANKMRDLIHRFEKLEPILRLDPEVIINHDNDLELQMAIEAFGSSLEEEKSDALP